MTRALRFLSIAVAAAALSGLASAEPAPLILFPGDAVPFAELVSQNWFAVCADGAPTLKKVTVSAKPMPHGRKGAVANECKSALVLLRGAPWLAERALAPFPFEKQEASAKIAAGENEINLWVTAEEPNGPYLNVERGGVTQYFWTSPKEQWDQWELLWAGDVDGDGLPDFITRAWSEEEAELHNAHAIFLSRLAAEGEIYGVGGLPFEKPTP